MKAQIDAIDRLIEAVETDKADDSPKGEWPLRRFHEALPDLSGKYIRAADAYRGSLDAAKALHDALLPGWMWEIDAIGEVWVWGADGSRFHTERDDDKPSNPARAWLIAILRAYRAQIGAAQ
jgi:hypothetical protein